LCEYHTSNTVYHLSLALASPLAERIDWVTFGCIILGIISADYSDFADSEESSGGRPRSNIADRRADPGICAFFCSSSRAL